MPTMLPLLKNETAIIPKNVLKKYSTLILKIMLKIMSIAVANVTNAYSYQRISRKKSLTLFILKPKKSITYNNEFKNKFSLKNKKQYDKLKI